MLYLIYSFLSFVLLTLLHQTLFILPFLRPHFNSLVFLEKLLILEFQIPFTLVSVHAVPLQFSSVQSLSPVWLFATPWTAARQASLSITNFRSLPNSCLLSRWCHPNISSSVIPFSSCLQSFPTSGCFQMSQLFASGAKILEFQLQHQSFQWTPRTDFL